MSSKEVDWTDVEAEINRIVADCKDPFDADTLSNVRDLVSFLQGRCPIPKVSKSYWSAILLDWKETPCGPLQLEVFDDRIEVYRFKPKFGVWYENHTSGQPFSPRFVAELPPLA
jgi:hypothetical protein